MSRKLSLILVAACGSSTPNQSQADAPGSIDAAPSNLLGAAMPQDVLVTPGAILATPTVIAITYDNDANRADIESFYQQYAASTAWAATTAEYGVGPLTVKTEHIAGNAPAKILDGDTSDITNLLTANLTGTKIWGDPDPTALYSFIYPQGSVVDDGTTAEPDPCCDSYDGYHYDTMVGGIDVSYSIQCQCAAGFDQGLTQKQQITIVAGHELVETVTDPKISTTLGWAQTDDDHAIWTYVTEGELADLCEYAITYPWLTPPGMTFATQRVWSNAAAKAGHDPCVGDPTTPYYQTVPDQPDTLSVTFDDTAVSTKGLKLAMNTQGMLTLHVLADDASAGPFTITIDDLPSYFQGGVAFGAALTMFTVTQPTGTFHPGDTLTVPIKVIGTDSELTNGETVIITTTPASGPATSYYALIGQ